MAANANATPARALEPRRGLNGHRRIRHLVMGRRPSRQLHGERGTLPFAFALERDRPAVHLHDLAHDRETEAEAADLRGGLQLDLLKWLEHSLLEVGRYADSGVLHNDCRTL